MVVVMVVIIIVAGADITGAVEHYTKIQKDVLIVGQSNIGIRTRIHPIRRKMKREEGNQ